MVGRCFYGNDFVIIGFLYAFAFVFLAHCDSYIEEVLSLFPYKNSLIRKSGKELFSPLINSISKSNEETIACHLIKICLETKF